MVKGKIVRLELLSGTDDNIKYYIEVGQEQENVANLTDHFIGISFDKIKDSFCASYEEEDSLDFLFCIMLGEKKIGLLYILREAEKRTAEIQILLSEEKYRKLGLGFDAIYAAIRFAKEELNLHSITFKFASHNQEMVKAFQYSQYGYERISQSKNESIDIERTRGIPDIIFREEFNSKCRVSDYHAYTFVIDDQNFPYEDFLRLASGKHAKYKNEEGKLIL